MSWELDDVNLIIVNNGLKRYWAGVKNCGHVLMDERLGLWADNPEPDLSWINKSSWGEMLKAIDEPLEAPIYGSITVDFDARKIIDHTGFGQFFDINLAWLALTWRYPRDAPINKKSLRAHLKAGRVQVMEGFNLSTPEFLGEALPKTLPKALDFVEEKLKLGGWFARFSLPPGWTYDGEEEDL
jgi:hypothetical protein